MSTVGSLLGREVNPREALTAMPENFTSGPPTPMVPFGDEDEFRPNDEAARIDIGGLKPGVVINTATGVKDIPEEMSKQAIASLKDVHEEVHRRIKDLEARKDKIQPSQYTNLMEGYVKLHKHVHTNMAEVGLKVEPQDFDVELPEAPKIPDEAPVELPQGAMKFCPYCGVKRFQMAAFCGGCGGRFPE